MGLGQPLPLLACPPSPGVSDSFQGPMLFLPRVACLRASGLIADGVALARGLAGHSLGLKLPATGAWTGVPRVCVPAGSADEGGQAGAPGETEGSADRSAHATGGPAPGRGYSRARRAPSPVHQTPTPSPHGNPLDWVFLGVATRCPSDSERVSISRGGPEPPCPQAEAWRLLTTHPGCPASAA